MRCPKCHYISYDASDRCRNCGYEFSLTIDAEPLDLPIQTGDEPIGPFSDFALTDLDAARTAGAAAPARAPKAAAGLDLPLFKDRAIGDDRPLVTPPAVPRAPLAVRKSTPPVVRPAHRPRVEEPELDLGSAAAEEPADGFATAPAFAVERTDGTTAPLVRRLAATVIDVSLLALVDAAILYFTLQLCGLQPAEIGLIPPVPFLSFLVLQNGGYFVAFVAVSGQTLGKMALSIKVVPVGAQDGSPGRVPLGTAVVRAAVWFLTVLPAGLGLVPAVLSADRRAVHDRLAGTCVVRA
jgi:uncharacterized RDD family membrane protein YckC